MRALFCNNASRHRNQAEKTSISTSPYYNKHGMSEDLTKWLYQEFFQPLNISSARTPSPL
jgi:hypothetical protein